MNWGTKIFVVLALFVIGMAAVGLYMVGQDQDSLVESDYYERGINFDEVYQRRENLDQFQAKPTILLQNDTLQIRFVHRGNQGQLKLKRSSDSSLDQNLDLSISGDVFLLPVSELERGSWNLHLEWEAQGHPFLHEQMIYLN